MTSRTHDGIRRGALISMLVLALSLAAAACGGGSSNSSSTSTALAGGATSPAAKATASSPQASGDAATSVALRDTALGKVIADSAGMTLYTFKNDTKDSGKSACSGGCATNWPPLIATGGAPSKPAGLTGDLTTVTRDDGALQVAYNGMPLYRFAADKAPGDTKGDGVGGIWSAAKP